MRHQHKQDKDVVGDFVNGQADRVSALGFNDLGDLTITPGSDTVVQFSTGNFVTLNGVASLAATDFIFA